MLLPLSSPTDLFYSTTNHILRQLNSHDYYSDLIQNQVTAWEDTLQDIPESFENSYLHQPLYYIDGLAPMTALLLALSRAGAHRVLRILLHVVPHLDMARSDDNGWTLLFPACVYNRVAVLEVILKCEHLHPNLDINQTECSGWTPLYTACTHNRKETIAFLLRHPHIQINKPDLERRPPLYAACR